MRHLRDANNQIGRVLAAALTCLGVSTANAAPSCDQLFKRLRDVAASGQQNDVHVLWTTNYFVPARDALFLGTTAVVLRPLQGDLFGTAVRARSVYSLDRDKPVVRRGDIVSLRIRRDGMLMLNDTYGPFDPVCASDKFAIINVGDAVEVFSLSPRNR